MTDGSGISCPFYENDCRGPPPKKVALDCGSEAYFVELSSLGAAGSVGVHSSFSTLLTACHSAIWDPSIYFVDTFAALGTASDLHGELVLSIDPPSKLRTSSWNKSNLKTVLSTGRKGITSKSVSFSSPH